MGFFSPDTNLAVSLLELSFFVLGIFVFSYLFCKKNKFPFTNTFSGWILFSIFGTLLFLKKACYLTKSSLVLATLKMLIMDIKRDIGIF